MREIAAFLDIDITSAVWTSFVNGYDTIYVWSGVNRLNLQWQSLETLGDGNVRVAVNYTKKNANGQTQAATWNQTFAAADAVRGAELSWSVSTSSVSSYSYEGLNAVSRVQMWKTINGVEVLMYDSGADTFGGNVLTWPKSPVEGTQVTLRYRPQGSNGAWMTLTTASGIETLGSVYWVGLGALPAGFPGWLHGEHCTWATVTP